MREFWGGQLCPKCYKWQDLDGTGRARIDAFVLAAKRGVKLLVIVVLAAFWSVLLLWGQGLRSARQ